MSSVFCRVINTGTTTKWFRRMLSLMHLPPADMRTAKLVFKNKQLPIHAATGY